MSGGYLKMSRLTLNWVSITPVVLSRTRSTSVSVGTYSGDVRRVRLSKKLPHEEEEEEEERERGRDRIKKPADKLEIKRESGISCGCLVHVCVCVCGVATSCQVERAVITLQAQGAQRLISMNIHTVVYHNNTPRLSFQTQISY